MSGALMRSIVLLALSLVMSGLATAAPTKKTSSPLERPMQVHVVRSAHAGCEPLCLQWIAAQGKIGAASVGQFKKALRQLGDRKLPILIDSGGGSVNDALAIGRLIRAKGLDVVVTRTAFTPCEPADAACRKSKSGGELRGLAQASRSKCASSCAFILAGGSRRFVGQGAFVGVHQITTILRRYQILTRRSFGVPVETRKTLVSEERAGQKSSYTQSTYGNITRYLADMGIGDKIMPLIMSTPGNQIRWLKADELRSTRLATHALNGEQLITGAVTSKPEPAAMPRPLEFQDVCGRIPQFAAGCTTKTGPSEPMPGMPAVIAPAPLAEQEQ